MTARQCAAAVLVAILACQGAAAGQEAPGRVYGMPRYEAEHVITDWLAKAGYEVSSEQAAEKVVITASRGSSSWEIVLRHSSALATEVTPGTAPGGRAETLWRFLSEYQEGSVSGRGFTPRDVPDAVLRHREAVVCIGAVVKGRPVQLSGLVVDASGLVLCTAHTLKDPSAITIVTAGNDRVEGSLVRIDFRRDLALIDCPRPFRSAVEVGAGVPAPVQGQRIVSMGCPRNHSQTLLTGVVSGPPRLVEGQPLLQARLEVEPGSSGSPVFDEAGNLLGMVQGRMKGDHHAGFIIPLQTIISFIKER